MTQQALRPTWSNYHSTVFGYLTLTRVHGKPTFESICALHKEVMANTKTVNSELGGGAHGHLGLILSPRCYALLSNSPYHCPHHLGQLVIPTDTMQHVACTMSDQHTERLRIFRAATRVENALKQQIKAAVEPQYIESLRDPYTGRSNGSIYEDI